jgi:4-amino-4-deoxy-L-arabinose transferase-like glycosyltransferase
LTPWTIENGRLQVRTPRWFPNWQLLVLVTLALIVRLWGIDFGLPYAYHIDEPRYISAAVGILQTGDFNPGWFHQPSLYTYLITVVLGGYYLAGWLSGHFSTTGDLFHPPYHFDGFIPLPGEFLLPRIFTALLGVLTVWALYHICRRWFDHLAAVVATGFLALSIFHVTSSHFIATDVPVALFILISLYLYSRVVETGQTRYYVLAGIMTGLAVGTKYSAYVLVLPAVISHLLAWRYGRVRLTSWQPVFMASATAITALATTPFALFDYPTFIEGIRYEWLHHKVHGHIGAEGNSGRWFIVQLLTRSDRWMTLLALAGYLVALWRREWRVLLVLSFALAYFYSMASNIVYFERFLIPLTPVLALAAGYLIFELKNSLRGRQSHVFLALLLLAFAEPAVEVAKFNQRLAQTDVRTEARLWIRDHIPADVKIARELFTPNLDQEPYAVYYIGWLNEHPIEWYREQGFDYLIFAFARYGVLYRDPERYAHLIAQYEFMFEELELIAIFDGPYVGRANHDIRIYRLTP